jgi:homospermidine synthase
MTEKIATFNKHLWIIGYGSIAVGATPLIFKLFNIKKEQITVIAKDLDVSGCAQEFGLNFKQCSLSLENFKDVLAEVKEGDIILNLSVDVGCIDIMKFCIDRNCGYIDTSCEPWEGGYFDLNQSASERSMYFSRIETQKEIRDYQKEKGGKSTIIGSHGANPGIVSHFVKVALLNIAKDTGYELAKVPTTKDEWAELSHGLGIKVIHIAERDSQVSHTPRPIGQIQSTWSVDGYYAESISPSELAWGTHEKRFPEDGRRHDFGDGGIYLDGHSHLVRVRSWTPTNGSYQGYLIPHDEAMTIGEYLTVKKDNQLVYRPTVHFSYHPCDAAILSMDEVCGKNYAFEAFSKKLLNYNDIVDGMDELGVLLAGHKKNAYWFGSQLTIQEAKKISPYNTATTLQVVCGVIGALYYVVENPSNGYLEVEELDHTKIMEVITPYLGRTGGFYTEWTPLVDRGKYFEETNLDASDPWQFSNVRYLPLI